MTLTEERSEHLVARRSVRLMVASIVVAAAVGIGLSGLGWLLLSVGGSLLVPALVVALVGAVIATGCWIALGNRRRTKLFLASCLAFTLGASLWTFFFALPVSLLGSATTQAQSEITELTTHSLRVASAQCKVVRSGTMGLLDAPYRVCGFSPGPGFSPFLNYTSLNGRADSGLGFTPVGEAAFPDECTRHLEGPWWAWNRAADGVGDCQIGYTCQGSG